MKVWWHKAVAWGGFLGVLWLLRDFVPLFFLTFVFTFIMQTVVRRLSSYTRHRKFVCVASYLLLLVVVGGLANAIGSRLVRETQAVAEEYRERIEVARAREAAEAAGAERARRRNGNAAGAETATADSPPAEGVRRAVDRAAERVLGPEAARTFRTTDVYEAISARVTEAIEVALANLWGRVSRVIQRLPFLLLQFALSILFSFLIVWDMPNLAASVRSLERGRLRAVYAEIAPGVLDFGRVLGKAFQAQAVIAVANTLLTAIGLWVLGIQKVALLLTVVFFCSFIPVLGVVISSVPIGIFALKAGGVPLLLASIVMVLLVGEHLAGIWGLLLGVPVAYYLFEYVIQGKTGWPPRFPPT